MARTTALVRPRRERLIAGVAAGLARWLNIDITLVRLLFILLALVEGIGIVVYLILWLLMPSEEALSYQTETASVSEQSGVLDPPAQFAYSAHHPHWIDGLILVLVGLWLLAHNLSPYLNQYTPIPGIFALVGLGIILASVVSGRYGLGRMLLGMFLFVGGTVWQLHEMDLLHIYWEEIIKYWPTVLIALGLTIMFRPRQAPPAVQLLFFLIILVVTALLVYGLRLLLLTSGG